ncbi:hypothetical protein Clacol_007570 [Clathrus columnatus]|uniref:Xylanolytic transcriptional activator regulatory domain-containing protein n=1 Tax=Clathrus columnatus TaxID=1419009 RepID=A0AAV5AKU9_9AGAM|nr:hypothetical protein Clacol_007570 [Clathrus columnatus]
MPAARTKKEDARLSPSSDDTKDKDENGKAKRKYLRRLQEAAAAAAVSDNNQVPNGTLSISIAQNNSSPHSVSQTTPSTILSSPTMTSPFMEHPTIASPLSAHQHPFAHSVPSTTHNNIPLPPSRYPIAADTYHTHQPSPIPYDARLSDRPGGNSPPIPNGRPSSASTVSSNHSSSHTFSRTVGSPPAEFPPYPLYNWSAPYKHAPANTQLHAPSLPPLSYYVQPHRLEDVAPRETILLIISLFFDFVYPLTPCIHKPSFMADLQSRREERDPLFFALVMSTVASTCVQVPRSYLPLERREVRKLAQTCHEASRHISVAGYDPPTSIHVVIRYFDTVYHFCEGHDATSHASFGEAAHIAVTLHMHEEASYEGLDPIECEIRRRVFWLLFGGECLFPSIVEADKSMSILLGRPICLRDEDCTLHFPKEVDDEYITPNGILPQPPGKTAIISGLNYISRIFALLGEILVRIRVDKRSPPQGHFATARLEEIRSLHQRIVTALAHAPPPLQLKKHNTSSQPSSIGYDSPGFTKATFAEVKDFFDNPNASRANASNPYLVMQANLYVTQQLVRFVIEQYRDELITSMRTAMGEHIEPEPRIQEDREAVASDLLNVLHSIPIQSIATNGPSLVHKVRFVASTLLDAVRKAETAPASAARAHAYLWDFLSILSEIERNYLLDDDQDGPAVIGA